MIALAALMMSLALSGPNGLQALHNPAAEQSRQDQMMDRLKPEASDGPASQRKPGEPPTEAERRAAAWRADHLTCANRKGRTAAQFAAECRPAPNP